jgi:hypothetical protein
MSSVTGQKFKKIKTKSLKILKKISSLETISILGYMLEK